MFNYFMKKEQILELQFKKDKHVKKMNIYDKTQEENNIKLLYNILEYFSSIITAN